MALTSLHRITDVAGIGTLSKRDIDHTIQTAITPGF
jgi:hypothetical protein